VKTFRINSVSIFKHSNINLAIGNFDGIHKGHKQIIKKLVYQSNNAHIKSAILSFSPHPRQFFTKNYDDFHIINEDYKIKLLSKLKVDYYISCEFDALLASFTAEKFIKDFLVNKLKIKSVVVGYDFRFGKDRQGNIELLKELSNKYNYEVSVIKQVIDETSSLPYSSSLIRKNIQNGKFEIVSSMLGRNWSISGKIIYGDRRASKINFPTANISPKNLIKPKKGVYAIKAKFSDRYYDGVANFGVRPTIDGTKLILEAHLFDFNKDIYGKSLTVEFLTFIREEKKFNDFKSLTVQIKKDIQTAKKYHLEKK